MKFIQAIGSIAEERPGIAMTNCFFTSMPNEPLLGDKNTALLGEIMPDCEGGAAVVFSDVMGGGGCDMYAGIIEETPFFVPLGYQLESSSMCINAGESWFASATDITGAYRDLSPDMGAYEYFVE